MTLQGFYTNKGRALAAKIAGGVTPLTVTRVAAGSGHTTDIPDATALPDIRQTLSAGSAEVSGFSATLPVTLAEASAASSYSLTELGLYAADPDEGEILMQVYQLSAPQEVTAGGEGVLRFYLRQAIGAQGVSVICAPAGLISENEFTPVRSRVLAAAVPDTVVNLPAAEVQDYIDALPRLLTENLTVAFDGTIRDMLDIHDFYGCGSLCLIQRSGGTATLSKGARVKNCAAKIQLRFLNISPSSSNVCVFAECARFLFISECDLTGNAASVGLKCTDGSNVHFYYSKLTGHSTAILCLQSSTVVVSGQSAADFSRNTVGGQVWRGGIILLAEAAPDLLGGSTNDKSGGIIVKKNGTLL